MREMKDLAARINASTNVAIIWAISDGDVKEVESLLSWFKNIRPDSIVLNALDSQFGYLGKPIEKTSIEALYEANKRSGSPSMDLQSLVNAAREDDPDCFVVIPYNITQCPILPSEFNEELAGIALLATPSTFIDDFCFFEESKGFETYGFSEWEALKLEESDRPPSKPKM